MNISDAEHIPEQQTVAQLLQQLLNSADRPTETTDVNTPDGQIAQEMRQLATITLTTHPDPDLRREAAELLANHQTSTALQTLLKLAQDPEADVRQQALSSLEKFDSEATYQGLIQGLQDSDYLVRSTAAEVLGSQKNQKAVELLIQALKDPYYIVRATAAEALGNMEAFLASPALQDLLLDDDQWVRFSAAESLSQIEPEENVWPLLMELNSTNSNDQKIALQQLGGQIDKRAIPFLIKSFKTMPEHQTQILKVFERFHDPLVIPALIEVALFTEQPHLRETALIQAQQIDLKSSLESLASWLDPEHIAYAQRAVEALTQLPSQQTTPLLQSALQLPDTWIRTVAMLTLHQHQERVELNVLKHLLKEQNPDLVQAALQNLLQHHPSQCLKFLAEFVSSKQIWRRKALASSLHLLGNQKQTEIAEHLLQDTESDIREAVLKSLGHGLVDSHLPLFIKGGQDSDPWVRLAAIEGLEQTDAEEAQNHLVQLLKTDTDLMVRARAAEALEKKSGHKQVLLALTEALSDSSASVRKQAIHAIFSSGQSITIEKTSALLQDPDKNVCLTLLQYLQKHPIKATQTELKLLLSSEDPQVKSAANQAYQTLISQAL